MKKIIIALLLIIPLILSSCGTKAKEANAPVQVVKEKDYVEASGIVKAENTMNIMIDFPSSVEKVYVKDGQRVKKDDVLIDLDMGDYKMQIANKEHELKVARMELQNLQAKLDGSNTDVNSLQNDLEYAQDIYDKAAAEYANQEKLYDIGAISRQELDEYKDTMNSKKGNVDDIKYSLEEIQNNKQVGSNDVKIQQENVASLENSLRSLKNKLNKNYIKENSIISGSENGVVCDIGYKPGDMVSADKKVLSIMDVDGIYISANVAEEFIKEVKPGAEVTIHPLADSAKTYKGKVRKIAEMAIEENGQTFVPVEISIDYKDGFLLPNFNVDVEIKK